MALPTERLKTLIEAALFVAGRPLNVSELKSSVLADFPVTSRYSIESQSINFLILLILCTIQE